MSGSFALSASYGGFTLDARAAFDAPVTALFGASGSGKSTLLEALAGLRPEVRGEVVLRGRRVDGLPPAERRVGWVPQDASLFPHLRVRGQLEFARRAAASRAVRGAAPARGDALERALDVLELRPLLERRTEALSGGERQRVAVARALASEPDLLLLDEPLAAIDRPLRARVVPFLAALPAVTGVPMLVVTHDPAEVAALAQHVLVLEAGRIVAQGAPHAVLAAAALGPLEALSAENVFEVAEAVPGPGVWQLRTRGGETLVATRAEGFPAPRRVAVRAEDVLVSVDPPGRISAQNVLRGLVTALRPDAGQVLVEVQAAERWRARLTARAVKQLGLADGAVAWLLIKAHSVGLLSEPTA